jgi:hypothetical protein
MGRITTPLLNLNVTNYDGDEFISLITNCINLYRFMFTLNTTLVNDNVNNGVVIRPNGPKCV